MVFVTGVSGYIGQSLTTTLRLRGHEVTALVRRTSSHGMASGCKVVVGDALDAATYRDTVAPADTFVHLVGTRSPSPRKARQFMAIDLACVHAAVRRQIG